MKSPNLNLEFSFWLLAGDIEKFGQVLVKVFGTIGHFSRAYSFCTKSILHRLLIQWHQFGLCKNVKFFLTFSSLLDPDTCLESWMAAWYHAESFGPLVVSSDLKDSAPPTGGRRLLSLSRNKHSPGSRSPAHVQPWALYTRKSSFNNSSEPWLFCRVGNGWNSKSKCFLEGYCFCFFQGSEIGRWFYNKWIKLM